MISSAVEFLIVSFDSASTFKFTSLKLLMQVDGDLVDNKTITLDINAGGVLDVPKDALIEDGNIIELDPNDFQFVNEEDEEESEEEL